MTYSLKFRTMKPHPSFSCHKQPIDLTLSDHIDLSIPSDIRRDLRKAKSKLTQRRTDPVHFVDLMGTANYDAFFGPHLDDKMSLNTKGFCANLHWSFKNLPSSEANNNRMVSEIESMYLTLIAILIN